MIKLEWRLMQPSSLTPGPQISTSLTQKEANALAYLAADKDVLEIGSAYGYSAIVMALAGASSVYAVDPHSWIGGSYDAMAANVQAYDVASVVTIRTNDSFTVMPELIAENRLFDLVWIDGDHEYPAVAHDVLMGLKLLKPTGYLACHDYDEATCPGVRQALDEWKAPVRIVDTLAIYGPDQWRE